MVMLDLLPVGTITGKSQVDNYHYCGHAFHAMSILDFITNTYEEHVEKKTIRESETRGHIAGNCEKGAGCSQGHLRNLQTPHHTSHIYHQAWQCVLCSPGHNVIANFIGPWVAK